MSYGVRKTKFREGTEMKYAKRFKAYVSAITIAAMLAMVPTREVNAGLKEAMNSMFVSTSTSAQVYNSQRLMGVYGGSMSLRAPGKGINIVQFARPRIDAGCGGIDIFFGSFSFINGAQFEQLIRSIAANATGFAIKAAIKLMCEPCEQILSDLEDRINALNSLAKNTCAIAKSLVNGGDIEGKIANEAAGIGKALGRAVSSFSDWVAGENKEQTQKPSETAQGGSTVAESNNKMVGNAVWKAGMLTMSNGSNTLSAFVTQKQAIELLMSLFGTLVLPEPDPNAKCDATASPQTCDKPPQYKESILTWAQILRTRTTSPNGLDVYTCANEQCTRINTRQMSLSEWGGVEDIVNTALFGTTDVENRGSWTDNSIIGSFALKRPLGASNTLDARSKIILDMMPFPLLRMLFEAQKIPGAPEQIGIIVAKYLPSYFEYVMAIELMKIGKSAFVEQTEASMPDNYKEQLLLKEKDLYSMRPDPKMMTELVKAVYESLIVNQRLTASQIRGSSSSDAGK